jgi:hypothetical protein
MSMKRSMHLNRRAALSTMGVGLGSIALQSLLAGERGAGGPHSLRSPHFRPRAKHVILVYSTGGLSQLDTFDPKPELNKRHGQLPPEHLLKGERFAFINPKSKLLGSPFTFEKRGDCGMDMSDLLPNLARVADKSTLIRSVKTDNVNHTPAQVLMATGFEHAGRPSLGAWVVYGLGSGNRDLPAFVDMYSNKARNYSPLKPAGFLPGVYQGVTIGSGKDPIYYLNNPDGMSRGDRRATVDAVNALNRRRYDVLHDPEITTRIEQYEMAFRMQAAVPELLDLSQESETTLRMYGAEKGKPSLASNMLMARRLVERGVRFVQVRDGGWDHHDKIFPNLKSSCGNLDQPLAALVEDLDQRGLLDDTLIVWSGEFGRTPMVQGKTDPKLCGRDHHKHAFSVWMAGGGVKRGFTYGATDDLGYHVTENPVHVHDLNATILGLLGLDHEELTYYHAGRDHRLTDVYGEIVEDILA